MSASSILPIFLVLSLVLTSCSPARQPAPDLAGYPWIYLRDGEAPAEGEAIVEVVAAGDVMLGRGVAATEREPLVEVAPWLRTADVAIANLECVVAPEGDPRPGPYRLEAPAGSATALRRAGFDVLGLANNHALDYGPEGLAGTVERIGHHGLAAAGAGEDSDAAFQPRIVETAGLRLAFLAFNDVPDPDSGEESGWTVAPWDEGRATAAVAAAQGQADAVIVLLHWGYEYELRPDPRQRNSARALIEAGADLVIGHHPHVVQGTEVYSTLVSPKRCCGLSPDEPMTHTRNGLIAYSLGNLVFDQEQGDTRQGLALRALFDRDGLRAVQALPVWAGPRPRLMAVEDAEALLARVQPPAERLGFVCTRDRNANATGRTDGLSCRPEDAGDHTALHGGGVFRAGSIDLTGDGSPERVQLANGQVVVYENGAETWHGLPEWDVVDVALGDPNDDGRGEMILALNKPDGSHPFIAGYREGTYRVLWGGSAVARPIRELDLEDVDGDGVEELLVLEEAADGSKLSGITIWRWHGWGFTRLWKSAPGTYRNLAVEEGRLTVEIRP